MARTIARAKRDQPRLFPYVSAQLYAAAQTDDPGARVLRLAQTPFSWQQRYLAIQLDAQGRLARLLLLHCEAFRAELEGRIAAADFFWREFHAYLAKLWDDDSVWVILTKVLESSAQPAAARRRLVDELFIDVHCAFHNGRVRAAVPAVGDRAFAHSAYAGRLLDLAKAAPEVAKALIASSALQIEAHKSDKAWEPAIVVCEEVLGRFPEEREFQDELAGLLGMAALSLLRNGESEVDVAHDAEALERSIARIEAARRRFPLAAAYYEWLAQLWRLRAIKLTNSGYLASALGAARWARCFDGDAEAAVKLEEQLVELMPQLERHVTQLQASLAADSNAKLTEKGYRMVEQVRLGMTLLTKAEGGAQAADIAGHLVRARSRGIWHAIGLPILPADEDERPQALVGALARVLAQPPAEPADIAAAWTEAAAGDTQLALLDRRPIEAFLLRRLFPDAAPSEGAPSPPDDQDAPVVMAADAKAGGSEPGRYWLGSRQDLSIKLTAVAAVVLLAFALIAYIDERSGQAARDQAFGELRAAAEAGVDERVMRSAEAFLGVQLRWRDGREAAVRDEYARAFSRWFVARAHNLDAQAQERIARYSALAAR